MKPRVYLSLALAMMGAVSVFDDEFFPSPSPWRMKLKDVVSPASALLERPFEVLDLETFR